MASAASPLTSTAVCSPADLQDRTKDRYTVQFDSGEAFKVKPASVRAEEVHGAAGGGWRQGKGQGEGQGEEGAARRWAVKCDFADFA